MSLAVFAASVKQFPKRLVVLTEGDSWFSYPLNANIADYIEMMSDFSILRLEHNGDEARDILAAGSEQLKKLRYYLKNYPVDALLLSAGGNDLVSGELSRLLAKKVNGATWHSTVNLARLTTVLDDIVGAYTRLLDARDTLRPKCVVLAHSYCYFEPSGRKATGPFGLLNLVDERCGGVFESIDDVIPAAEREAFMSRYQAAAGFAREKLNAAPPIIAPGARVGGRPGVVRTG